MKNFRLLFLFAFSLLILASCGKDDDPKDDDKLDAPTLISPVNNASVIFNASSGSETFDWADVSDANEYQIQFSTSSDFSNIIESDASNASNIVIFHMGFSNNTTYYWRVRALAPGFENSDYSEVFTFSFGGGSTVNFNLLSPANNSTNIPLTQTFTCENFPNASVYRFIISGGPTGSSGATSPVNSTSVTLAAGYTYTWYVEVEDVNGAYFDSPQWSFSTVSAPACTICGFYQGLSNGNLEVPLTGTDTTFSGTPMTVNISENAAPNSYEVVLDISALLSSSPGTLAPVVDGLLSGNTLNITNQSYTYQGLVSILINGSLDFSVANATSGSFVLSGDAIGTINFSGTK